MFEAAAVVCLIGVGELPVCISLKDERGPYKTEAKCEERLAELSEVLPTILPGKVIKMEGYCSPIGQQA